MQLPTTTYRHGRNQGRRGNNTSVSPHCFTAHPVMGGEERHYTHLTAHCTSPVTLEGGYDKARTPRSKGFGPIRSASTRPRRPTRHNREGRTVWRGTPGHFSASSSTASRARGWSSIPRARRYSHLKQGSTKHRFKAPIVLASSRPIKGRPGLYNGKAEDNRRRAIHNLEINISSNHLVSSFSPL
jgi:hypothetical protein